MDREPLPHRIRPRNLSEFIGQDHIVGDGTLLRSMIESDKLQSAIFYGPPGTGKTTLAEIIANTTNANFIRMNATTAGIKDAREAISAAKIEYDLNKRRTILFVDECHRHAKNQQEAFLPSVENGTVVFIGATTENPYFSIAGPLISRSHIFQFEPLAGDDLRKALMRGVQYYQDSGKSITVGEEAIDYLAIKVDGDARKMLSTLELIVESFYDEAVEILVDTTVCKMVLPNKSVMFDRSGDGHFDALSAIQGAIQASDVDGAILYLAWAINCGEDLNVICRRLLVTAAEDVGICDPMAMVHTHAAVEAARQVGYPEANLILASAVAFLAMCPRSKASARAIWKAMDMNQNDVVRIPDFLRDCHYAGSKELGHGAYQDGHNIEEYHKIVTGIFKAENGVEVKLMKENLEMWRQRRVESRSVLNAKKDVL